MAGWWPRPGTAVICANGCPSGHWPVKKPTRSMSCSGKSSAGSASGERRSAAAVAWSVPGARPMPRSMRPGLIISGPSEESTDKYYKINRIIPKLTRGEVIEGKEPGEKYTTGDYTIDEKHKSAALTEEGVLRLEKLLNIGNLYDPQNIEWNHHVQQALRAHVLYQRDREYVVRDGDEGPEVVIVDEFTGRLMPGRRWSDGLHQAVEAKEGVKIADI